MTKWETRLKAKARLETLGDEKCAIFSDAIIDAVTSLDCFKNSRTIFVYLGTKNEPNTTEIVGLSLAMEKTVCVPKVRGGEMDAVSITPYTDFYVNKWGIQEPLKGMNIENIDLAIVPMLAFDGLKRVGHGGGYYDKFLEKHPCIKLGLAFDCQRAYDFQCEPHDIQLDYIVTEKRIIDRSGEVINAFGGTI